MSKCREAFEAECERLGLRTEKHWYDCGSQTKFVYPEEMYPLFKAAWNVRGKVDAEICQSEIDSGLFTPHQQYAAAACRNSIEQENEQ